MMHPPASSLSWRRAHRTFWILMTIAVVAAGSVSSAARAHPGPFTAVRLALSGAALIISVALAGRVFLHLGRARRTAHQARETTPTTKSPKKRLS
jgi:hypothetical protein